jgi:uncharacterized protein YdaU (DUF1376 family)
VQGLGECCGWEQGRVNYYEHHLGDWAAATGHLTWDEDMAYTRLLRAYYHHEKAIAEGQQYRLAKALTPVQRRAVDQVLSEFFELREGQYHQKRADAEIARYQDKQRKAKASADARWSQSGRNANAPPNAMRTHSEGNALQTPDTRHHKEPPNPRKRGQVSEFPPGFDRFWSAYPRKQAKPAAAKAFARLRADDALLARMLDAVAQQAATEQWQRDGGQFIPMPASWLNGQRWEDAPLSAVSGSDIFAGAE